jgi:hypothetical protein
MFKKYILLIMLFCFSFSIVQYSLAQENEERGFVIEEEFETPVPGNLRETVDQERITRAKNVIADQWEDFKVEGQDSHTKISLGAYIIHTKPSTGKKYDIGYCTVEINYPDNLSQPPRVKISNSNKRHGHPHPYVSAEGTPCYGGASEAAATALGSGDFERYMGFLYEYLTNSEGSPYQSPESWDEVKEG